MMRFAEELVAGDELAPAEGKESSDREKQLALHLVDELTGPFDPAKHPDEYRSAVLAAVDEKVEAGQVSRDSTAGEAPAEAVESKGGGAQVIDLAELLSRSIKSAAKPGPAKAKSADEASEAEASGQSEEKPEKGKGRKKRATG
jgi:DNA end-binding protein Ku